MTYRADDTPARLDTWIAVIGGFGQTPWSSGLVKIWRWLYWHLACSTCAVTCHEWDDDWHGLARYMQAAGVQRVYLIGYSYGVGHGAMTLARALKGLGLDVDLVVSCDGVQRPRWLKWRALVSVFRPPRISVPANVKSLHYLRQIHSRPQGHRFAVENGTLLHDHGLLEAGYGHTDADDSQRFACLVKRLFAAEFPTITERWGMG